MEKNNDSDYTRATSDYEPNFILKEPEDGQTADNELRKAIDPLKKTGTKATDASEKSADIHTAVAEVNATETPATESAIRSTVDIPKDEVLKRPEIKPTNRPAVDPADRATADIPKVEAMKRPTVDPAKRPEIKPTIDSTMDSPEMKTPKMGHTSSETAGIGAYGPQARNTVVQPNRPLFENPSYNDGSRENSIGSFADPRANFRSGGSASWQGGRRDRGAMGQTMDHAGGGFTGDTVPPTRIKRKKTPKPVTMSKRALGLLIAGCLLLSCLFGFGGAMVGYNLYDGYSKEQQARAEETASKPAAKTETAGYDLQSSTGSNMSVKEITAAAKDSVVEIRTEGVVSDSWMQEYVTEGAGSGVIISEDGYIMTNNHVISGANKIKVTTADEKEYQAELVGTDENNDVAVLKIDATGLKAATYGNSDELEVGDLAVAIGNPLGELGGTVTAGIISAKDRALSIDGKTLHLLQTDSSINPGNSGGGLFNDSGQLIGLVVAKSAGSDVEGLGFAIPVNTAANVAQQLIDQGYVSGQPSTGMTYQEGSSGGGGFGSFESMFGGASQSQVYIYSVNGNNAKKAGFEPGDVVLAIDDEEVTSFNDLSAIVTSHKVGDTITFTISRDGNEKKIKLELEEKKMSTNTEQGSAGETPNENGESAPSDENKGNEFPATPEDEGGSLFDYFFGW